MEPWEGPRAGLIPSAWCPKDSLLPNISGRQKAIPSCETPFRGRRKFGDAGEHLRVFPGLVGIQHWDTAGREERNRSSHAINPHELVLITVPTRERQEVAKEQVPTPPRPGFPCAVPGDAPVPLTSCRPRALILHPANPRSASPSAPHSRGDTPQVITVGTKGARSWCSLTQPERGVNQAAVGKLRLQEGSLPEATGREAAGAGTDQEKEPTFGFFLMKQVPLLKRRPGETSAASTHFTTVPWWVTLGHSTRWCHPHGRVGTGASTEPSLRAAGAAKQKHRFISLRAITPRRLLPRDLPEQQERARTGRSWFSALFWRLRPLGSTAELLPSRLARSAVPASAPLVPAPFLLHPGGAGRELLCGLSSDRNTLMEPRGVPRQWESSRRDGCGARSWRCAAQGCGMHLLYHRERGPRQSCGGAG